MGAEEKADSHSMKYSKWWKSSSTSIKRNLENSIQSSKSKGANHTTTSIGSVGGGSISSSQISSSRIGFLGTYYGRSGLCHLPLGSVL